MTRRALYEQPHTRFIASFIGHPPMNLLPATLAQTNGHMQVSVAGVDLVVPSARAGQLRRSPRQDVVLGIRPEDVTLTADGPFRGQVDLVEPLGRDDLLIVRSDALQINALAEANNSVPTGSTVRWQINTERMHLFDTSTGQSLVQLEEMDAARLRQSMSRSV